MGGPAEQFAGASGKKGKELLEWRLSAPMEKFKELRKMYNDAGVNIHIVKFGDIGNRNMPEEQIDYYFEVAKALGAKGITPFQGTEVPWSKKSSFITGVRFRISGYCELLKRKSTKLDRIFYLKLFLKRYLKRS